MSFIPKNKAQAEGFEKGKTFVHGFTDQIESLKQQRDFSMDEVERLRYEGSRVTTLYHAALDMIADKSKEIERLKEEYAQVHAQNKKLCSSICELVDALDAFGNGIVTMGWAKAGDIEPLIQRAREAVK